MHVIGYIQANVIDAKTNIQKLECLIYNLSYLPVYDKLYTHRLTTHIKLWSLHWIEIVTTKHALDYFSKKHWKVWAFVNPRPPLNFTCHFYVDSSSAQTGNSNIDGLVQDCSNAITNALETLHFCTKPSIWKLSKYKHVWLRHHTISYGIMCITKCLVTRIKTPVTLWGVYCDLGHQGFINIDLLWPRPRYNHIECFIWDVVTYLCLNVTDNGVKTRLKFGHELPIP